MYILDLEFIKYLARNITPRSYNKKKCGFEAALLEKIRKRKLSRIE